MRLSYEFSFWEAGGIIWAGSLDDYEDFSDAWSRTAFRKAGFDPLAGELRAFVCERWAAMPLRLAVDCGFRVRVVVGGLDEREREDWTARARWRLDLPSGRLLVSGSMDNLDPPALDQADLDDLVECHVGVPPGSYAVTIYAYPPYESSTGWDQIADPDTFPPSAGIEPEHPLHYFARTRPGLALPDWLAASYFENGEAKDRPHDALDSEYLEYLIQLTPISEAPADWAFDIEKGPQWEFRKPKRCPLGVPYIGSPDEGDEEE